MIRFSDIIDASAEAYPRSIALRCNGRAFTYADLKRRISKLVAVLRELGVREGDRVALISCNTSAHVELVFACARIGAVCVQCNVRLSKSVTARLLDESGARVVFLSQAMEDRIRGELDQLSARGRSFIRILIEGPGAEGAIGYEDLIERAEESAFAADSDRERPVLMLYTSGTTGIPRGVVFSHAALERRIEADARDLGIDRSTVSLCVLPMYHITLMSSLLVLKQGAQLVISDSRDAASIVSLIERYQVTFVGVVPFLLRAIVEHLEAEGRHLESLKTVLYGGEPIDQNLLERCQSVLRCGLIQGYGMTETASAITLLRPYQHLIPGKLATVGTPVEGVRLKIADDQGRTMPAGAAGEILVKTDMLMIGYFNDLVRTADAMSGGWYRTGDIGMFDKDGYLVLLGRKSNLVISGGENVYPSEVESCIRRLSDRVKDVVVLGVPDAHWGEALAAFVVRRDGSDVSGATIASWCKQQLGDYKNPKHVLFVNEIKRNATGKPLKDDLLALYKRVEGE